MSILPSGDWTSPVGYVEACCHVLNVSVTAMYVTYEPSPTLAIYVECYWSWRLDEPPGELDVILPDAAPEIIVHFDAVPLWRDGAGSWLRQPSAFLFCAATPH